MIAYVNGILSEVTTGSVVVESGGIGYEILTYSDVIRRLPSLGSEVKIITYMEVKEDDIRLFGFLSSYEKTLFKQLISVNGVGPKGALSILDELGTDNLAAAIMSNDYKTISKANGIGPKTAQKVILELRDKISLEGTIFEGTSGDAQSEDSSSSISEAAEALCSLGYSNTAALKAIRKVEGAEEMMVEQLIVSALKFI